MQGEGNTQSQLSARWWRTGNCVPARASLSVTADCTSPRVQLPKSHGSGAGQGTPHLAWFPELSAKL